MECMEVTKHGWRLDGAMLTAGHAPTPAALVTVLESELYGVLGFESGLRGMLGFESGLYGITEMDGLWCGASYGTLFASWTHGFTKWHPLHFPPIQPLVIRRESPVHQHTNMRWKVSTLKYSCKTPQLPPCTPRLRPPPLGLAHPRCRRSTACHSSSTAALCIRDKS
jgi:hypothetical protein